MGMTIEKARETATLLNDAADTAQALGNVGVDLSGPRATAKMLIDAANAAEAAGKAEIDFGSTLDALDDAARADQESALAELQARQ